MMAFFLTICAVQEFLFLRASGAHENYWFVPCIHEAMLNLLRNKCNAERWTEKAQTQPLTHCSECFGSSVFRSAGCSPAD